jgi:hypothetical protein
LQVEPSGAKSFYFSYRCNNRARWYRLGAAGTVGFGADHITVIGDEWTSENVVHPHTDGMRRYSVPGFMDRHGEQFSFELMVGTHIHISP